MTTVIENVLIAEDDLDDFEILREAIESAGYTVVIERAENGAIR